MSTTEVSTATGLRAWAKGIYPLEAGVELLIRAYGGRFAREGQPWINAGEDGFYWVDAEKVSDDYLSGGERRLLSIATSLLDSRHPVDLNNSVAGLDRETMALVLAALAHANGSHEHSGDLVPDPNGRLVSDDGTRFSIPRLPSLYPWPKEDV